MTDAETAALVAAAAGGDGDAFTELVRAHHAHVFRWALAISGEPDLADDLAQEVWIKVYRGLRGFRGGSKFTTWLYRITYNTAVSAARTRRRHTSTVLTWFRLRDKPAIAPQPDPDPDRESLAALIHQFLGDLPPRQRAALALADFEGLSTAEVAERMGISESTVRVILMNARRAIRGRLHTHDARLFEDHRP